MSNKTGDFDVLKLTNAGRDMLTQGRAGHVLTFTKVVIGDGTATGSAIDNLTAIKSPKLILPIAKNETVHAGQMRLQFRVSNSLVNTSFLFKEIGLMAKVDNGEEKLYAYTTCGDKAKMVYDNTYPIQEKIINIDTVTDNAVNVKVILDLSIMYATRKDIDIALDKVYPVGSIYTSVVATNPADLFGFGEWEALPEGRMLLAQGNNYKAGTTGGSADKKLSISEMPAHSHGYNTQAAGDHNHWFKTTEDGNHHHGAWGDDNADNWPYGIYDEGNRYHGSHSGDHNNKIYSTSWNGVHSHTGTTASNGSHTHKINMDGGGQSFSIMNPYLSVYMWKRVK